MDLPHIKDFYSDVALYLVNSHHSLHGIKPMTPGIVEIAGLHIKDEDDPLSPVRLNKLAFPIMHNTFELFLGITRFVHGQDNLSL